MINLNINPDLLKKVNDEQARAQYVNNWYYFEVGERDKRIRIGKSTQKILKENGINVKTTTISYNKFRDTYTVVEQVLKGNDCFYKIEK